MAHVHKLPDGTDSGPDEELGNELHDHGVTGQMVRTGVAREGEGHLHTIIGMLTGPPVSKKKK